MIEATVLAALTSGSPAPTAAGDQVYAGLLPFDSVTTGISFSRISTDPLVSLAGDSFLDRVRIQIDCWAPTYGAAKSLGNEARFAMANYAGLKSMPDTMRDDFEPDTRLYRVSMDFFVWETSSHRP